MSCLAAPVNHDWLLIPVSPWSGRLDLERESFVLPCLLQRAWGQERATQVEIWVHFIPCLSHIPNLTSVFCWIFLARSLFLEVEKYLIFWLGGF